MLVLHKLRWKNPKDEKDDFVKCISTGKDLVNLTRWDFNKMHLWALSTTVFFSKVSSHRSWAEQKLSKLSKWTIRVHDTNRNWGSQPRPAEAARPVARSRASVRSHGSLRRNFAPRRAGSDEPPLGWLASFGATCFLCVAFREARLLTLLLLLLALSITVAEYCPKIMLILNE